MKYDFVNCSLQEIKSGRNAGEVFLQTTAVLAGSNSDTGFKLPFFNPKYIQAARQCVANNMPIAFTFEGEIEERKVNLGAVYVRRATDAQGNITDNVEIDPQTKKPRLYRTLRVHCIFQYSMHDAYYVEGPKKGMRIMEDDYDANGRPIKVPAKAFDLDDLGQPIKLYMQGWAPEERRDQVLSMFYKLAPEEYQTQTGAETAEQHTDNQQQQQQPGNPFEQMMKQDMQQQGAPQGASQGAPQQTAANAADPIAQQ